MTDSKAGQAIEFEFVQDTLDNPLKVLDTNILSGVNVDPLYQIEEDEQLDMTRETTLQPMDGNIPVKILHPMYIIQPMPRQPHWPILKRKQIEKAFGFSFNMNQTIDCNIQRLLFEMSYCNTPSRALRTSKTCIIQLICDDQDEPLSYDLRSFEDKRTGLVNLEPVINRMLGMVLLKCNYLRSSDTGEQEDNQEVEEDEYM